MLFAVFRLSRFSIIVIFNEAIRVLLSFARLVLQSSADIAHCQSSRFHSARWNQRRKRVLRGQMNSCKFASDTRVLASDRMLSCLCAKWKRFWARPGQNGIERDVSAISARWVNNLFEETEIRAQGEEGRERARETQKRRKSLYLCALDHRTVLAFNYIWLFRHVLSFDNSTMVRDTSFKPGIVFVHAI